MNKKRVLLAMSGGIDSSISALLLQKMGYEVKGITYKVINDPLIDITLEKAANIAEKLKINHIIKDITTSFRENVIEYFMNEYLAGRTPNPCVFCNPTIKWTTLIDSAKETGCDHVATGHYATITRSNKRWILKQGNDDKKDQSYFLWRLSQNQLAHTLFPLSGLKKDNVMDIAKQEGLDELLNQKESQEICFIPDNDYRQFLVDNVQHLHEKTGPGNFINAKGEILGQHQGHPFYTIGQRKGLNVAVGHPLYVISIHPEDNTIVLGKEDELKQTEIFAQDINMIKYEQIPSQFEANIRIRYNHKGAKGLIQKQNKGIKITFKTPVSAATPGQSVVFYDNDEVIGGGIIQRHVEDKNQMKKTG